MLPFLCCPLYVNKPLNSYKRQSNIKPGAITYFAKNEKHRSNDKNPKLTALQFMHYAIAVHSKSNPTAGTGWPDSAVYPLDGACAGNELSLVV